MATVLLVRHGRTTANAGGILAGRMPDVHLDAVGEKQAARAGARISAVPIRALVSSPQERCRETARLVSAGQREAGRAALRVRTEKGLAECDYGEWQGRKLRDLAKEKLWRTVQVQPSAVTFPGGESMVLMKHRAVSAVRRLDAEIEAEHGPSAVWVAVTHGDIVKSLLADALGMHLDLFQRIQVDPASISVIRYTADRPYVLATNTHDGDLAWLSHTPAHAPAGPAVGGGAGPGQPASDGLLG